jgi:amidase
VEETVELLESLGHQVDHEFPKALADPTLVQHFTTLWSSGLFAEMRFWETTVGREITPDDVEPLTWALAEIGRGASALQLIQAYAAVNEFSRAVAGWWEDHDLLLTPTLGQAPVKLGTFHTPEEPLLGFIRAASFVPFTPAFNVTGQPAISLPLHWNAANLPIGVQLVGAYAREDLLLRVAAQLEQARPWADRRPPIQA